MKQIKTIKNRLDNAEHFDTAVNESIKEGWTLTKREVLIPNAQECHYTYIMLYAELERGGIAGDEEEEDEERRCQSCMYYACSYHTEPCYSCKNLDKWEAGG